MDIGVIDRVRKLLALAKNNNNANEAALAASRAADLMAAHSLSEAALDMAEQAPERILEGFGVGDKYKRVVSWKGVVANASAFAFGCKCYWFHTADGKNIQLQFFGRESAVQAAAYTTQYLWAEVERLTEIELSGCVGYVAAPRKHANNFRLGAASEISRRLREQVEAKKEARKAGSFAPVGLDEKVPPLTAEQLAKALVRVCREQEEVDEAYNTFRKKAGIRSAPGAKITASDAFAAGRAAGKTISLGGAARGNLGAPARRLGSGS